MEYYIYSQVGKQCEGLLYLYRFSQNISFSFIIIILNIRGCEPFTINDSSATNFYLKIYFENL